MIGDPIIKWNMRFSSKDGRDIWNVSQMNQMFCETKKKNCLEHTVWKSFRKFSWLVRKMFPRRIHSPISRDPLYLSYMTNLRKQSIWSGCKYTNTVSGARPTNIMFVLNVSYEQLNILRFFLLWHIEAGSLGPKCDKVKMAIKENWFRSNLFLDPAHETRDPFCWR